MPATVTSPPLAAAPLTTEFSRVDIEILGLDHAGASYEGRVFINLPEADESTPRSVPQYAGSFHIFGHGGCLGDVGHCDVHPRRPFDPRPAHPLTPARKVVVATDAVRRALQSSSELTVTVVPVILSTTRHVGRPEHVVKYEYVRIVAYR